MNAGVPTFCTIDVSSLVAEKAPSPLRHPIRSQHDTRRTCHTEHGVVQQHATVNLIRVSGRSFGRRDDIVSDVHMHEKALWQVPKVLSV